MSTDITVVGHLTRDPELRFTPAGKAVANFSIASNVRKYNKQTDSWEDGSTVFLNAAVWETTAENLCESLVRGAEVIVQGTLEQREYEKDGIKRTVIELRVKTLGAVIGRANTVKVTKLEKVSAGHSDNLWAGAGDTSITDSPPF